MVTVDEPDIAASLARIDAHMERQTGHMERQTGMFERHEAMFERHEAMFERHEAMFDDLKEFMREITLRVERNGREMVREIRGLRADSQAQREGFLRVIDRIDRLDPGGSSA